MNILIFSDHHGNERFFLRGDRIPDNWPEASAWSSARVEHHYIAPAAVFDRLADIREKAQAILDRV